MVLIASVPGHCLHFTLYFEVHTQNFINTSKVSHVETNPRALTPCMFHRGLPFITKTRPCNILQFFTAVKKIIFR